jgi:aryl-alcohol dehydrogenase-like predicted oxidoreductase
LFFEQAQKKNIGIIARVPLSSGLLTGKFSANSTFEKGDHRNFNRNGEMFDKGETFSGVDYATGLEAVSVLQEILSTDFSMAAQALRWILMFDAVSTVIPGASSPEQISSNLAAVSTPAFKDDKMLKIKELYEKYFKKTIHHWW